MAASKFILRPRAWFGVIDLTGAARPSIAKPVSPQKVDDGCIKDIANASGYNIFVASDNIAAPSAAKWRTSLDG
jgi:hypothetical protein